MPYSFKRPLRCVPALLLAIIIGLFSMIVVWCCAIIAFVIHNHRHPVTLFQFNVSIVLAFLILWAAASKAYGFFRIYRMTPLLSLTHPCKNMYELNMHSFSLVYLTRVKRCSPMKIAAGFESEFIECVEKAVARFPSDKMIFQTSTWLVRKRNRDLLRSCGFRISEKPEPNGNVLKNHSVVALAIALSYGFHSGSLDRFKRAKFYQITWTKKDIAHLEKATDKRRTVYLEKTHC